MLKLGKDILELIREKLNVRLARAWWALLRNRTVFLERVNRQQWPEGLHPLKYFFGCYAVFLFFYIAAVPISSEQVKWYVVWNRMTIKDDMRFLDAFKIEVDSKFRAMAFLEYFRPGSSPLSDTIRKAAGADDATTVGLYLATKDLPLAKTFMQEAARASTFNKYAKSVVPIGAVGGLLVCALPMHLILRRRGPRLSQTYFVLLYWAGWWAPIFGIAGYIGVFIPFTNGALILTYMVFMLGLATWSLIDWIRFFRATHKVSVLRCLAAGVLGTLCSVAFATGVGLAMELAINKLLALWHGAGT